MANEPAVRKNVDALARLADSTFAVPLVAADGTEIELQCREMPLTTMTYVISRLLTKLSESALGSLVDLSSSIVGLMEDAGAPDNDRGVVQRRVINVLTSGLPIVTSLALQMPELTERVLMDCIVDATKEDVARLSAEHAACIFGGVAERIDPEVLAEKLSPVFTLAATVTRRVRQDREKTITSRKGRSAPSS